MTIEEFVSTEHNGSGAAKGSAFEHSYRGYGYDCYTFFTTCYGCGEGYSDAIIRNRGCGGASGMGNPTSRSFGCIGDKSK